MSDAKLSIFECWKQSDGDEDEYGRLLAENGHVKETLLNPTEDASDLDLPKKNMVTVNFTVSFPEEREHGYATEDRRPVVHTAIREFLKAKEEEGVPPEDTPNPYTASNGATVAWKVDDSSHMIIMLPQARSAAKLKAQIATMCDRLRNDISEIPLNDAEEKDSVLWKIFNEGLYIQRLNGE